MLQISLGKIMIIIGLLLVIAGGFLVYGGPVSFIGCLPGDLRFERFGVKFYFPLTTCILLSVILSGILLLISRFR